MAQPARYPLCHLASDRECTTGVKEWSRIPAHVSWPSDRTQLIREVSAPAGPKPTKPDGLGCEWNEMTSIARTTTMRV